MDVSEYGACSGVRVGVFGVKGRGTIRAVVTGRGIQTEVGREIIHGETRREKSLFTFAGKTN